MYLRASVVFAALLAFPLPAIADARADAKAQVEFGIKSRAERSLEGSDVPLGEGGADRSRRTPEAWNNLAIGYEHQGRFDEADKAYQNALKLDPKNVSIRQNYDLFKEINDRTKRRRDR